MVFLTEMKQILHLVYVGVNCKRKKSGVKKILEISAIRGGWGRRLMAKTILNFHFDYLKPSLIPSVTESLSWLIHLDFSAMTAEFSLSLVEV